MVVRRKANEVSKRNPPSARRRINDGCGDDAQARTSVDSMPASGYFESTVDVNTGEQSYMVMCPITKDLWSMEHVMQYDVVVHQSDGKGGKECILVYAESQLTMLSRNA
jgi:hypothetical protein